MAVVKMINNKSQSIQGLLCVIAYACKDAKTNHEGQQLISSINCVPSLAFDEFMTTKRLYNQDGGRMFYHMVQSLSPEENITPEVAHEIACKLANAIPGFEIVVATHCDADHVHSHFVINSVNFETGMKYHSDQQSIHALWDASDKLCLQYGLSVIKRKQTNEHRMNDREYRSYMRGNSWKMALEIAIDDCMTLAVLVTRGELQGILNRQVKTLTQHQKETTDVMEAYRQEILTATEEAQKKIASRTTSTEAHCGHLSEKFLKAISEEQQSLRTWMQRCLLISAIPSLLLVILELILHLC